MNINKISFVDTETFGLNPDRHPIWEVAVIVNGEEHVWQVRHDDPVIANAEPVALDINKFHERYRPDLAVSPYESATRFAELTEGTHLCGAVISFDEERLRRMHVTNLGRPERYPWHYHLIDVEALAVGYLSSMRHAGLAMVGDVLACEVGEPGPVDLPWKSDELSAALGIECPSDADRHTALGDARWARAIYEVVCA